MVPRTPQGAHSSPPAYWRDCGHHLLVADEDGWLEVTAAFLAAYARRPELAPPPEANQAERALHARLLAAPTVPVAPGELESLGDPDAIENYRIMLGFRDRLLATGTIERAYLDVFARPGEIPVPPLFVDQLAHVILRQALGPAPDPLRARAGELWFREQTITIADGHVMAADREVVEMLATSGGFGSLGQLLVEAQTPLRTVELDVLSEANAGIYWGRDQAHDTVLNLNFAGAGLDAFCRVLEAWVWHILRVEVEIQPVQKIADERWVWHVGLDAEASGLLNDLYNGLEVGEARLARLLSLFRLEFRDPAVVLPRVAGRPVYLALSADPENHLRFKPQNLLLNLPLARPA